MKKFSVLDQINAIQKHVNRNKMTVGSWEIHGNRVFCNIAGDNPNCAFYLTIFTIVSRDFADLIEVAA